MMWSSQSMHEKTNEEEKKIYPTGTYLNRRHFNTDNKTVFP